MNHGSRRPKLLSILWLALPVAWTLTSCLDFPTEPLENTYESVWINASWGGGATGPPLTLKAHMPDSALSSGATICPAKSLILENHSTRFEALFSFSDEGLVFWNNCTSPAALLVCVSAGTGGNFSEFPVCNVDPRTTPLSRLAAIDLAAFSKDTSSMRWAETGVNLDLNVFYCGVGDTFAAGVIPDANETDCIR